MYNVYSKSNEVINPLIYKYYLDEMFTFDKNLNNNILQMKTQKDEKNLFISRKELYAIFIIISSVKVLLIPTYRSTDFEVHRNWLAITHSLPSKEWYISAKSQWTLDYPPLFGWFEFFLSQIGSFIDSNMLNIDNFNYESSLTILFQRVSVIVTDLMFLYGIQEASSIFHKTRHESLIFGLLSLCNIGLLLVDHIHFQYNGILIGILLLSIAHVAKSSLHVLVGALWFTILLNLKHIYLYIAPSFIVWLLKWYCLKSNQFFTRLIQLGIIVLMITAISFGPFIHQLPQVVSRLFPFKRGLVHAYWAANIWSLYIGLDKILTIIWKKLGWLSPMHVQIATMTGGLVQESSLTVLAFPTPFVTFIVTIFSMLPVLLMLFNKKEENLKKEDMVRCLVICALSSFIFGWHVHEKAILTAIIPLGILATTNKTDGRLFLLLSSAGHAAILPLLFPKNLIVFKIGILVLYNMTVFLCLKNLFNSSLLYIYEWIYVLILPFISLYETVLHKICFGETLPFFPLALTSCYCSIGILYCWIIYYYACYIYHQLDQVRIEKNTENDEEL